MSINKRIDEARKAFEKGDLEASRKAHSRKAIAQAMERHGGTSHQYIGDMVYGLDGIVTTFAVVSGVAGAALGSGVILILGLFVPIDPAISFPVSLVLSGVALFCLGAAKVFVTERNWLRSGLEMPVVGGLAAGVAFLVGYVLQGLGG
jgi:VIT1/CCC1 family predicted Fe2+/Mn2+ transporter